MIPVQSWAIESPQATWLLDTSPTAGALGVQAAARPVYDPPNARRSSLWTLFVGLLLLLLKVGGVGAATFTVTTTADSGIGSLRQALSDAKASSDADVIEFAIPGSGVQVIQLTAALPVIDSPVAIDGYTQAGARANTLATRNDAIVRIQLDGALIPAGVGLRVEGRDCSIRGLAIIGFPGEGILICGTGASNNVVAGNLIGVDAATTAVVGNFGSGVRLDFGASHNRIGGVTPADRNTIAGSVEAGVSLQDAGTVGNAILGNEIFENTGLGIDLNLGDPDGGSNLRQNFPNIVSALVSSGTRITAVLTSAPATTYRVEFFVNELADATGHGEGQGFLGSTNVTTTGDGVANFTFVTDLNLAVNHSVAATATAPEGNTSEFSLAAQILPGPTNVSEAEIVVDGALSPGAITATNQATVEIRSPFAEGLILYSLNGSEPRFGSVYTGPFMLAQAVQAPSTVLLRAVAFNADGLETSAAAPVIISFRHTPVILESPADTTVRIDASARLVAVAAGTPPLTYQWRFAGTNLPGTTNPTLLLPSVRLIDDGLYSVVVANIQGAVTSRVARLSVLASPAILSEPMATSAAPGAMVTFCVTATGTPPPTYQWRLNGANIPGATNTCHEIASVQVSDGGIYSVVVANDAGVVSSLPAELLVLVTEVQAGDDFSNRVLLVGASGEVRGTNVGYTIQPDEPAHAGQRGGKSAWYRWTAPAAGIAEFRLEGSGFDTLLAVYTGDSIAGLTEVASDDDGADYFASRVSFNAVAGTDYAVVVDGFAGGEGNFALSWRLTATAEVQPVILAAPPSRTVLQGESTTFGMVAGGTGLAYQWFFNGAKLSGATDPMLTITNVQPFDVGFYNVRIRNSAGRVVDSASALLEIGPASFQSRDKVETLLYPAVGTRGTGHEERFALAGATTAGFISVPLGTRDNQVINNSTNTYVSAAESNHCDSIGGASRWLALKPATNAFLAVTTGGSSIPTISGIYTQGDFALLQLACAIDTLGSDRVTMRLPVRSNLVYLIVADGYQGARGLITLNWSLGFPPRPEAGPTNAMRLDAGQEVTLACPPGTTNGVVPYPEFQWLRDGEPVPDATGPSLRLTNFSRVEAGDYRVAVKNPLGEVTNLVATIESPLEVDLVRTLFGINQLVLRGEEGKRFSLQASDGTNFNWNTLTTGRLGPEELYFEDDVRLYPGRVYRVVPYLDLELPEFLKPSPGFQAFRLRAAVDLPVVLQRSADLINWTDVATNGPGAIELAVSLPSDVHRQYFRLRAAP